MNKIKITILASLLLLTTDLVMAEFPDSLKKRYAPAVIEPFKVILNTPDIAEYKEEVPISVQLVQLPNNQTWVTEISFYSHLKPDSAIMSYQLSKNTLANGLKTRIVMSHGTNITYAIARLSDGSVIGGEAITKAAYACNGGF